MYASGIRRYTRHTSPSHHSRLIILLLGTALVLELGAVAWLVRCPDFLGFYAGGRLVGTPDLYDADAVRHVQSQASGTYGESLRFTRLPYYALLFKPLSMLPLPAARALWVALMIASVLLFLYLWGERDLMFLAAVFFPIPFTVSQGQDVPLLLVWVALAIRLSARGHDLAAGLVLALCGSKPHLFVLLPLLVIRQRRWKLGLGVVLGGTLLVAVSFAVAGPRWPLEWYAAISDPKTHPGLDHMPNFFSFAYNLGIGRWAWAGIAATVAAAWLALPRAASLAWGLSIVMTGSLLVVPHCYIIDCALLLPALWVFWKTARGWTRYLAAALLNPPAMLLIAASPPWPALVPALLLTLLGGATLGHSPTESSLSFTGRPSRADWSAANTTR